MSIMKFTTKSKMNLKFFNKNKEYKIELIDVSKFMGSQDVPTLSYDISVPELERIVGTVEYRFETGRDLKFYGNIGYVIYQPYRGHGFAYQSCMMLLELLKKEHPELHEVYITCNPDNVPSKKTIQKIPGTYLGTVDVDRDHELYYYGETQKEIYVVYL